MKFKQGKRNHIEGIEEGHLLQIAIPEVLLHLVHLPLQEGK